MARWRRSRHRGMKPCCKESPTKSFRNLPSTSDVTHSRHSEATQKELNTIR
jgi:hypothetical protein